MSDLIYREDAKDFARHAYAKGLNVIDYLDEVPAADCLANFAIKEQPYLFIFEDDTTYEMPCGISLKDAVWEMAKYTGNSSEMFRKSLFSKEFKDDDVNDIINLFNHWCYYSTIKAVYIVKEKIYPRKENA